MVVRKNVITIIVVNILNLKLRIYMDIIVNAVLIKLAVEFLMDQILLGEILISQIQIPASVMKSKTLKGLKTHLLQLQIFQE
jgi:hypothetical protein